MELPARTFALVEELKRHDNIVAIGIGGSQASGTANNTSDSDAYVFTNKRIDPAFRRKLIDQAADSMESAEIAIPHWGDEDAFVVDGTWHEFAYFDANWFFDGIDAVINQHQVCEGYTTSFVHTLANMHSLYDPQGLLASWQKRVSEYPDELARAIMERNYRVSSVIHASYRNQIARAVELNDPVAVNHRVAAFMACVTDIAFASLRMWHPGEKRQLQYLRTREGDLPAGFIPHITAVLTNATPDRMDALLPAVDIVVADLSELVHRS